MSGPSSRAVIASTGVTNLASVCAALARAGLVVECTDDPERFEGADLAILPGVGSFAAGMQALRATGLDRAVVARAAASRPLLAICLGLQLLCESSAEAPDVSGLGIIPTRVTRMIPSPAVRVPQLGWNFVDAGDATLARDGLAYFANSYAATTLPSGWQGAWFEHGDRRIAAVQRGGLLACQFHPELSGAWGRGLLRRWIRASSALGATPC